MAVRGRPEAEEGVEVGSGKGEFARWRRGPAARSGRCRRSVVGQGQLDRDLHVRDAELAQHRVVVKLDHRMDDALPVDEDLNPVKDVTPKRWTASMTSRPLFIRVAESIVILAPMFQLGCLRAILGVMAERSSLVLPKKGPPEASQQYFIQVAVPGILRGTGKSPNVPSRPGGF